MSRDYYIGEVALIVVWLYASEKFVTPRKSVLLLFEDDLWFNNDGIAGINQIMRIVGNTPTNTDLISLYSPEGEFHRYNSTLDVNNFVCKHFSCWSTAFTLITQKGAPKILAAFRNGVNGALDGFFWARRASKVWAPPETTDSLFFHLRSEMDWIHDGLSASKCPKNDDNRRGSQSLIGDRSLPGNCSA